MSTLTAAEKESARTINAIALPYPCQDIDGLRAAMRTSRERHGEDRHEVVKWHALHARPEQLA